METASPYGIEILGFITTTKAEGLESRLHKKYANYRLQGEWFDIPEAEVKSVLREHDVSNINSLQILRSFLIKEKLTPKEVMDIVKWYKQYSKADLSKSSTIKDLEDETKEKQFISFYLEDLKDGMLRPYYDTGFYEKGQWISSAGRKRNKSRATFYRLFKKYSHLFEEKKDGKTSLFRLKEMEV